jgi:hypothetical protein
MLIFLICPCLPAEAEKTIFIFYLFLHKLRKELIINIYMLIKSVIKAGCQRLIVVILHIIEKIEKRVIYGL